MFASVLPLVPWKLLDPWGGAPRSTGWPALDAALGGGLPRAGLVEVVSERGGQGALTLALALAARAEGEGGVVLVDAVADRLLPGRGWPAGALRVRPRSAREALEVLERALRCGGVAAAVGWLGRARELDLAQGARLRQACRAGGTLGLLITQASPRASGAAGAPVRLRVAREACPGAGPERLRVQVERARGAPAGGEPVVVEVGRDAPPTADP